jgi:hypothetical protein
MAVIANPYEQTPALGIGKRRYRTGQFASISHTVFEVLLLVLTLANQAEKIVLIVHTSCKGKLKIRHISAIQKIKGFFINFSNNMALTNDI